MRTLKRRRQLEALLLALSLGHASAAVADTNQDWDGDGVLNRGDNCPYTANASQVDSGGLLQETRDGIGTSCQCGDTDDSGRVSLRDLVIYERELALGDPLVGGPVDATKCDVAAPVGTCDSADLAALRQAVAEQAGALQNVCVAFAGTLSVPEDLTAYAGDGRVLLDWDALSTGAAQYRVFRGTAAGGPYSEISAVPLTESSFEDSGVTNGTTYHYVVRAEAGGTSGDSNEAAATPSPATGQNPTPVGGSIVADTTWSLLGSPYEISTSIDVSNGATLTIEPGVEVRMSSASAELIVGSASTGKIVVLGSEVSPVLLHNPGGGGWRRFALFPAADPGSEIDGLTVRGGGAGSVYSVALNAVSSSVKLSNVRIEQAQAGGVFVNGGGPRLHGWDVEASPGNRGVRVDGPSDVQIAGLRTTGGMEMAADSDLASFHKLEFQDYASGPYTKLQASLVGRVMPNAVFLGDDPSTEIEVVGSLIKRSGTWTDHRYRTQGGLELDDPSFPVWTLEAGAELRVAAGGNHHIDVKRGSVRVQGTEAEPVVFTSGAAAPAPGDWTKFLLWDTSQPSDLRHLVVEYAGRSGNSSVQIETTPIFVDGLVIRQRNAKGLYLRNVDVVMTNGTIEDGPDAAIDVQGTVGPQLHGWSLAATSGAYALEVPNAANFELHDSTIAGGMSIGEIIGLDLGPNAITGNTFTNYDTTQGLRLAAAMVGDVTGNNTFFDLVLGESDMIVLSGAIVRDAVWPELDYMLDGTVTVDDPTRPTWTIAAGAELAMKTGDGTPRRIDVVRGAMRALGTSSKPVLFTSQAATVAPGQWTQIHLYDTSEPSELLYVQIEGAGAQKNSSLFVQRSPVSMEGLTIAKRGMKGLYLENVSGVLRSGTIEAGAEGSGVVVTGSGAVTLEGWTISGDITPGNAPYAVDATGTDRLTISGASVLYGGVRTSGSGGLVLRDSEVRDSPIAGVECVGSLMVPVIEHNVFVGNATAIDCGAGALISRNTISGSTVGIHIPSAHPALRIRNNNLSGNATAILNSDASNPVDARLNWWGTPAKPISGFTGLVEVSPWLASAFSGSFSIEDASALPEAISPGTATTFSAAFSEVADWSLEIRDAGGVVVHTESGTGSLTHVDWDGVDQGVNPPPGVYAFAIDAVPGGGGSAAPGALGELVLEAMELNARIDTPTHLGSLVPGPVGVTGSVTGSASPSFTLSYAKGSSPAPGAFQTISGVTLDGSGSFSHTWDTSLLQPDVYTLRLEATGTDGKTSRDEVRVNLVEILTAAVGAQFFSPNSDGVKDVLPISGSLSVDVPWVVEIRNQSGALVREISGSGRDVHTEWDGLTGSGGAVPNGPYTARLRVDAVGATMLAGTAERDTTPPVVAITSPGEGAGVIDYGAVSVQGTATDTNFAQYTADYFVGSGSQSIGAGSNPVSNGLLGVIPADSAFSPMLSNGDPITIRVRADDLAGNVAVAERVLDVDRIEFRDLQVADRSIQPGLGEEYELRYRLSHPVNAFTLSMHASGSGALVEPLAIAEPRSAGYHIETWDGTSSGSVVAQGVYFPAISASAPGDRDVVVQDAATPEDDPDFPDQNESQLATVNGQFLNVPYSAIPFDPFRNDLLTVQFVDSQFPRLLNYKVKLLDAPGEEFSIVDESVVPGQPSYSWDGRTSLGDLYTGRFTIFVADDAATEWLSVGVTRTPPAVASNVRANPYVFHPSKAGVTNLSFDLNRSAAVRIDLVSPNQMTVVPLADEALTPGSYSYVWNALDSSGLIFTEEGSWDVTIEVTDAVTGELSVTRGTVMLLR